MSEIEELAQAFRNEALDTELSAAAAKVRQNIREAAGGLVFPTDPKDMPSYVDAFRAADHQDGGETMSEPVTPAHLRHLAELIERGRVSDEKLGALLLDAIGDPTDVAWSMLNDDWDDILRFLSGFGTWIIASHAEGHTATIAGHAATASTPAHALLAAELRRRAT